MYAYDVRIADEQMKKAFLLDAFDSRIHPDTLQYGHLVLGLFAPQVSHDNPQALRASDSTFARYSIVTTYASLKPTCPLFEYVFCS